RMTDRLDPGQRARPLSRHLRGAAQVDDRGHADVVYQPPHVRRRQILQVVAAQQPTCHRALAVTGGQRAQVADVDRPVEIDPFHPSILAARGLAGQRYPPAFLDLSPSALRSVQAPVIREPVGRTPVPRSMTWALCMALPLPLTVWAGLSARATGMARVADVTRMPG